MYKFGRIDLRKYSTFKNIHSTFPLFLSKLCKEHNVKHFIHISSLGINEAIDSNYAKSNKGKNILDNFSLTTILDLPYLFSR